MKKISMALVVVNILIMSGYSNADGIDDVLSRAKKEGKVVMLELGSVGCRPCEQMKPVMEKLRTNYKGKLEVVFIDVRRDGDSARRYRVYVIPTQVFVDKIGKEFFRHTGFFDYEEIVPVLKKAGL